jgi:signal peptidase II
VQRRWTTFVIVVGVAVVLDALTKAWALASLEYGHTRHLLGGLLPLTLSFNRGIAFGLQLGDASRLVFTLLAIGVLTAAVVLYRTTPIGRIGQRLALCLMCAGAVGNLIDRIVRPRGVVDFIGPYDLKFMVWPIFNLADIWVVVGTIGYALALWRSQPPARASRGADSASLQAAEPAERTAERPEERPADGSRDVGTV